MTTEPKSYLMEALRPNGRLLNHQSGAHDRGERELGPAEASASGLKSESARLTAPDLLLVVVY